VALISLLLLAAMPLAASPTEKERLFELHGKVFLPSANASRFIVVGLAGADNPYFKNGFVLNKGAYRFKKLLPGLYVVSAWVRQYGLYEKSVTVGPSTADQKGSVELDLRLDLQAGRPLPRGTGMFVSVRQLSIPPKAKDEFAKAYQAFGKHDEEGGISHLEKAITIAPQFAEALNTLGTVYHHRGDPATAEQYFRESLKQNPQQFDASLNLSNTLFSQHHFAEALEPVVNALKARPQDPKALCQHGWVLLQLNRTGEALTEFREALRLSPDDISRPQLGIIAVYSRQGDTAHEKQELEDYLRRHPDDPEAPTVRARLQKLQ
jgi:Tfp pilus assembly protein PilF